MRRYKNHFGSLVLALLTHLAAAVTVLVRRRPRPVAG